MNSPLEHYPPPTLQGGLHLGPITKFALALSLPIAVLSVGAYKVVMALAVSSESIKYLPSNLVYLPDILTSLAIFVGTFVVSLGITRVLFSFSRFVEVRVGYTQLSHQLATSNPEDNPVHSLPELSQPVIERNLPQPSGEHLSQRGTTLSPADRHTSATTHARLASFRAAAKRDRGVIDLRPVEGVSLPSENVVV